jgi:hypothetical protein
MDETSPTHFQCLKNCIKLPLVIMFYGRLYLDYLVNKLCNT